MKPEERARQKIDQLLEAAGWIVQDYRQVNLRASLGVAVRDLPLKTGPADYVLFVDARPAGVIEAKPFGTTLSGVAEQSGDYLTSIPESLPHVDEPPRFGYESTGIETMFRDLSDPDFCSRRVFSFHRPETLNEWLSENDTIRARLRCLPPLMTDGLRDCQIEAIANLERSFAEARPRALIQMASGSGKTYTAVSSVYRLIRFAGARRVLFLVDRSNLGRQARSEFQNYTTPDDGRKFTELYNIQHLTSNTLDPVSRVCITTIQRLYSMLKGEPDLDSSLEEQSMFEMLRGMLAPAEISYNPAIPIEMFDFIITDECHRSIYHLWRQVFEYFDAFIIGLTATPSKQTLGFFNQNLVMEYSHERAVADGVGVGYDVYRIITDITQRGSLVKAGFWVDKRHKLTRKVRWEQLDEDLDYPPEQLDRSVVATDQIRTIVKTFRDKLFTEIFPGRSEVPKTLIFAKSDSHAEDIVHIVREEFGKGNEFCKKITYRTTGEKPEDLITSFRNSYNPRIAVTVDMIATGTDIRPLECVIFMRDVKSRVLFEQMKGRGTRTVLPTEFHSVNPDAMHKTHCVLVDAIGVCENDKTDSRPLDKKKSVPFDKLLQGVALGNRDEDTLSSLASRLTRLDKQLEEPDKRQIESTAQGVSLRDMARSLLDAIDPDRQMDEAKRQFGTDEPTEPQIAETRRGLAGAACAPFDNPTLRDLLADLKTKSEQIIDTVSQDSLISVGFDPAARQKAQACVDAFKQFIEDNKNELTALQILYSQPYVKRALTYEAVKQLAEAIKKPPYRLTPELVWHAYEQLESSRVKGAGPQKLLTNIVSLIRFAVGGSSILEPFSEIVDRRFEYWLSVQKEAGREFTDEQILWLNMIQEHIATSLAIGVDDFELAPFAQKGGAVRADAVFHRQLDKVLDELNKELVA